MKPFKYAICPEYGGRTARPHYHLLFFGIDNDILKFFIKDWRRRFGFVDRRRVNLVNPEDNSNGFAKACAYVSKYISKGIFETVKLDYVPRPRITVSKYLGLENPFELRDMFNFHLCRDLRRDSFALYFLIILLVRFIILSLVKLLRLVMVLLKKILCGPRI